MSSFIPKCIDENLDPSRLSSGRPDILISGIPPYVPRMLSCSNAEVQPSPQEVPSPIQDSPEETFVQEVPQAQVPPPEEPCVQTPPPQAPCAQAAQQQVKACISCGQVLEAIARFCRYCGVPQQVVAPPPVEVPMNFCAYCGFRKRADTAFCPNCGKPCM